MEKKSVAMFFYFEDRDFFHRKKIFLRKIFFEDANQRRDEKYFFFSRCVCVLSAAGKECFSFVHEAKRLRWIEFYCVQF